jgi:single-strand DNA-binding protein
MSGSVNKCIIVGNLGKDPEIKSLANGSKVCNLSVATSESWIEKSSGERKTRTEWHRVTIWNEHLIKVAEQYLRKGAKVYIEGQLETRKWQDQSGVEKYSTEVVLKPFKGELVMLDGKKDDGGHVQGQAGSYAAPTATHPATQKTAMQEYGYEEDGVPF